MSRASVVNSSLAVIDCEKLYRDPRCRFDGFNYRLDPRTGKPVGSAELYQFLLTWALMAHCPLAVGMGQFSFFSGLMFQMMCAMNGECPQRLNIQTPDNVADLGTCHYLDKRDDCVHPIQRQVTHTLPESMFREGHRQQRKSQQKKERACPVVPWAPAPNPDCRCLA